MLKIVAVLVLFLAAAPAAAGPFQPWIDGTGADEPQTQTQRYDRDTYVIRQSVRTNFEAPFLYLLFGRDRALLLDTGAGGLKVRPAVEAAIGQWLAEHHRASIPLVVAHSHGHGDHHAGDAEFAGRPDTVVVGLAASDVAKFFGVADWPRQIVRYDLGGRKLDVIPTPGHHPAHIMIYDERDRLLLSGDSLYPGRLYVPVNAFGDFVGSIDRVAGFVRGHPVKWILGAHIEMTAEPTKDFPMAARTHPHEHVLELTRTDLADLQSALHAMNGQASLARRADFIVQPLPAR
jgi:glyoxylase-like metal-dependent hydrolase (beta-lactamase superfamily II)